MKSRHGLRVPYTTKAGVQIGILHTPKPQPPRGDCLKLQSALLDERTTGQRSFIQRLFGAFWELC
jgi:hypothetical protein